ncbi:MAG TPA: 3,4-dihydroxy-2-butanone-4-phosphate synthase [Polyangia bacterium]|jgi:3,4-dihydroxy 2-butanone 4-phosphate synthase/GTP cyclohydrolase II|nr:3,4-dihydroxy-2-butanone-4-phosphate synthase [Polyangia bacterium]
MASSSGNPAPAVADRVRAVQRAIDAVRAGGMVVLVDDEDRENEGDLVMAAELITPEAINFMARHGRGLICLSLTEERVKQLALPMMAADNRSPRSTAFTVSIDARRGMTTGISARERAETVRVAVAAGAGPDDILTPGHIFPLRARRGGVLVRSGHTEGSVDLARLAGHEPAGVICEIMRDDGEMARMPDLEAFARQHNLPVVTIADLIEYRLSQENLVHRTSEALVRPRLGGVSAEFRAYVYTTDVEDTEYLALVLGNPAPDHPVLVRVQSASVLRDVFGVTPGPDGTPATLSLRMIEEAGEGILLYVYPRGRASMLDDFAAQTGAVETAQLAAAAGESRLRDFGLGAQVLAQLGVRTIRLLTNHPRHIVGVGGYGLQIVECLPIRGAAKVVPLRERENEG